jgi:DNA ligase D-like protein (predicted 3'-phosphoesterase)
MPKFVIQEHDARTHHFDFRLEKDGVFKSWAVPKGIPVTPGIKRLAVQVEDHALEFGDFEGRIPEGEYGAGEIRVWDKGVYLLAEWSQERIVFTLRGARISDTFTMVRFSAPETQKWLIFLTPLKPPPQG